MVHHLAWFGGYISVRGPWGYMQVNLDFQKTLCAMQLISSKVQAIEQCSKPLSYSIIPPGKHTKLWKSPFWIGKSAISMAIFNSYVNLPGGAGWFIKIPLLDYSNPRYDGSYYPPGVLNTAQANKGSAFGHGTKGHLVGAIYDARWCQAIHVTSQSIWNCLLGLVVVVFC